MKRPFWVGMLLLGLVAVLAACSKSELPSETAAGTPQPSGEAGSQGSPTELTGGNPPTQILWHDVQKRQSLEGRWVLLFFQRGTWMEVPAALIDITKSPKDSKLRANLVQFGLALSNPTLKAAQVTGDSLHLVMEIEVQAMGQGQTPARQNRRLDVVVDLRDGLARGNAEFSQLDTFLVAMVPTKLDRIQELRPQMLPEALELRQALESKMKALSEKKDDQQAQLQFVFEQTQKFVASHPDSTLTVEIYPIIFKLASEAKLSEEAVTAAADKFIAAAAKWGSRQALKARIDVAGGLIASDYLPQVAIKQLDVAMGQLNEETIPLWKADIENLKDIAITNQALAQVRHGTDAEKAHSVEILRKRLKTHAYDPMLLYEVAQFDESHGRKDEALQNYSQLAVLPLLDEILREHWKKEGLKLPTTRESAEALWKGLHGGKTEGFDKFLDGVYAQSMPKFNGKSAVPRPSDSDNRVILVELFTGSACNFCVAADVAFSHLLKTYAPTELIGLQYHEHIPKPDPLANNDSDARFHYYFPDQGGGTPAFAIGGLVAMRGGLLHQTNEVYAVLRQEIDRMLQRKTTVKIKLTAEPKGSAVAITAQADGAFPAQEPIRLRLAVAEQRVPFRGSNGIREHEMVVRTMPGGAQGVGLKDGKLRYEGTVDLKALRQQLDDYLIAVEEQNKAPFSAKPMDLSHLHLVAFVQNDQTREVYQAATIPFPATVRAATTTKPARPALADRVEKASPNAGQKAVP